ncbi:MAG: hypothetical protein K0S65_850 [Labilithrix sp.]|nr:hypothetical protein [Labilithrix sp.]
MTTFDPSRGDDGDLAALFASERRGHPQSPARQSRVWDRLEKSLPLGPNGGGGGGASAPASSSSSSSSSSLPASGPTRLLAQLSVAACLIGASMTLWSVGSRNEPASIVRPEPLKPPVAIATPERTATATPTPTPSTTGISVDALPTAPAPKLRGVDRAVPTAVCTICEERTILAAARLALREKHYEQALERIAEHGARHDRGQLAEERESLRVHVLVAMGRIDEAERRKLEFEAAFPESPLLGSVKRATPR